MRGLQTRGKLGGVALTVGGVCLAASAASAALVDDFSGLANGSDGTLGGSGSNKGSWVSRTASDWTIVNAGATYGNALGAATGSASSNYAWQTIGRSTGVSLTGATSVELDVDVQGVGMTNPSNSNYYVSRPIWLATSTQNGYGIEFTNYKDDSAAHPGDNLRNQINIVKFGGGTSSFGGFSGTLYAPTGTQTQLTAYDTDSTYGAYATQNWFTLHVRLDQSGAGAPVTITAWGTGLGAADTSYANPLLRVTDDGSGTVFTNTSIYDISTLNYVGDTVALGWISTASHDTWSNLIDNVNVSVVPEPSSLALFGTLALGGLSRRRRA